MHANGTSSINPLRRLRSEVSRRGAFRAPTPTQNDLRTPQSGALEYERERDSTPENRVQLLVCTNSLYLQHVAVCLVSLLVNNPNLFFEIVVVGRPSETLDQAKLH